VSARSLDDPGRWLRDGALAAACLLSAILLTGCDSGGDGDPSGYRHPLYGSWALARYDSLRYNGEAVTWSFTNDSVVFRSESGVHTGSYHCNDVSRPRSIDIDYPDLVPLVGIYDVIGADSLMIKFVVDSLDRPATFDLEAGYQVQYFRRQTSH
jgi:hypothetical protein